MYNQQQITQLDPLTQALITLKQGANLTTPKGDNLSVAGQAVQAMQPPQMSPQQPGMPPQGGQPSQQPQQSGIAGLAQNAATGAAIQQQQQQQAQQAMMQMAQQQQQQQPQFMAAEGGLARLPARNMGFREGGIVPTMGYFTGGNVMPPELPPEVESPEQKRIAAYEQQLLTLQKSRPDFTAQLLAAIDADKQARGKIAAAQAANAPDALSRLGALARNYTSSGMRGVSEGLEANKKATINSMEAARQADKLDALARVEIQKSEYALKTGDIDKAREYAEKAANIRNQQNQIRQTEFGNRANIYGTQVTEQGNIRTNASADARNQATLAAQAKEGELERKNRIAVAGIRADGGGGGNDQALKTELALYQLTMRQSGVDDLRAKVANMPNGLDGKPTTEKLALEKQANTLEANILKRFPTLSQYMKLDTGANPAAGPAPAKAPKFLGFEK